MKDMNSRMILQAYPEGTRLAASLYGEPLELKVNRCTVSVRYFRNGVPRWKCLKSAKDMTMSWDIKEDVK